MAPLRRNQPFRTGRRNWGVKGFERELSMVKDAYAELRDCSEQRHPS